VKFASPSGPSRDVGEYPYNAIVDDQTRRPQPAQAGASVLTSPRRRRTGASTRRRARRTS